MSNNARQPAHAIDPSDPLSSLADKLFILSNYFYPEPTGSAPPITDLAAWAAELGLRPQVLTARPSYPGSKVYPGYEAGQRDMEIIKGAQVCRVPSVIPRTRNLLGRLIAEISFAASAALRARRQYGAVVCICPSIFAVMIAPMFRRADGQVLAIVHDIQSGLGQALNFSGARIILRVLQALERIALNRCDHVVALTDAMASELRGLGVTRPIHVLPPQVDVKEIKSLPEPTEGPPMLLYSGNLGRKQGLEQVLDLASSLSERNNPAIIHIRGEGTERLDLERDAAARGLANVRFSNLAAASLHLIPQDAAGAAFALPSKVFSIMAAQRAFVATAHPESPLGQVAARSGGGVCVSGGNVEALADSVESLLSNAEHRMAMAAAGRRFVEREADREVVCRRLLLLLVPGSTQAGPGRSFVSPESSGIGF